MDPFALTLIVSLARAATPEPTLCVDLLVSSIQLDDLLAAMRARIARREVLVVRCETLRDQRKTPTWRLLAESGGTSLVRLTLTGPDLEAEKSVPIASMNAQEIVQLISLTAVEAVRPTMNVLLARMGIPVEPKEDLVAEVESVAAKCPDPVVCPEAKIKVVEREVPVRLQPRFALSLGLGPILGVQEGGLSGAIELGALAEAGHLILFLHTAVNWIPPKSSASAELSVVEVEAGVSALVRLWRFEVGVRAQNRLSIVEASGSSPLLDGSAQFFWNGGFGVLGSFELWRSDQIELKIALQSWMWPQPNRFRAEGETLLTQSHVELFLGPVVRFFLTQNSF